MGAVPPWGSLPQGHKVRTWGEGTGAHKTHRVPVCECITTGMPTLWGVSGHACECPALWEPAFACVSAHMCGRVSMGIGVCVFPGLCVYPSLRGKTGVRRPTLAGPTFRAGHKQEAREGPMGSTCHRGQGWCSNGEQLGTPPGCRQEWAPPVRSGPETRLGLASGGRSGARLCHLGPRFRVFPGVLQLEDVGSSCCVWRIGPLATMEDEALLGAVWGWWGLE